jgi:hypothetical protein
MNLIAVIGAIKDFIGESTTIYRRERTRRKQQFRSAEGRAQPAERDEVSCFFVAVFSLNFRYIQCRTPRSNTHGSTSSG